MKIFSSGSVIKTSLKISLRVSSKVLTKILIFLNVWLKREKLKQNFLRDIWKKYIIVLATFLKAPIITVLLGISTVVDRLKVIRFTLRSTNSSSSFLLFYLVFFSTFRSSYKYVFQGLLSRNFFCSSYNRFSKGPESPGTLHDDF